MYTSVWPLGEYEAAFIVLRRKDQDEGHTKASPCIPLVVENYIVSRGWSLDWLLGVCLPRDTFTSLASSPSHSSFFYYSYSMRLLHVSRNSRTRRFPIFYLFFRKKKIVKLGFFEKKTFIFVPLAFEKRKFSRFSFAFAVSSLGSCLLFLTFPFFRDHPSLLAWRPLEPRRVAADSWSGFLIYASLLSDDPTLLHAPPASK